MGENSKIAWTDHTMNFWMGCFKVSDGCKNCYADTLTSGRMGLDVFGYDTSKRRRTSVKLWKNPYRWNREAEALGRPARVFCLSLGDFFEDAPSINAWREEAWEVIRETPWLDWLILSKRPENMLKMLPDDWDGVDPWKHVWLGTSIEDNRVAERASVLAEVPAFNHFISYEPCLGTGDEISLEHIEWVICGGESGPGYRPMDVKWAYEMWARCINSGIAYFFKQDAGPRSEMRTDRLGEVVHEFPPSWDRAELSWEDQLRLA